MATQIKVLLKNDVPSLGAGGEVVKVRPGFARNFLLPRGLAVAATAGNLARVEDIKRQVASQAKAELEAATAAAAQLGKASVTISRAVGEEGKMYGSVTTKDIEDAFGAAGVKVDRKKIVLADAIKSLGTFEVPIKLHGSVNATLKVNVVKK
ncbi:MAG: ribosomal protein L9p [Polyangiaceae bacterium]|jgi:large subunit ribosomal protein L9|nr:ribosomal protein L9p [Polyangiaceae bacterium]